VTHPESIVWRRWRRLPLLAAAAVLPAALSIAPRSALAAGSSVELTRLGTCTTSCLAFVPADLSVITGATVTWVDPAVTVCTLRTTASPDPAFRGGGLPGYSFTFTVPGTYAYRCAEHPEARATLTVVRAAAAAAVAPAPPSVARAASKAPATAADPFAVTPVVRTHTPGYVPIALTAGSILLALLISQIGGRLESRSAARAQAVIQSKGRS
jgi:plastocyanin